MKIKVKSTIYPENQPSEEEWMREFNVGRMLFDKPNDAGFTWSEVILEIKKQKPCTNPQIFVGTNS